MTFQLYSPRIFHSAVAVLLPFAVTAMVAAQPASMHKVGQTPRPAVNTPRPAQGPKQIGPKPNQEHLAQMVGTTRSRINLFMNRFRKLGYIDYNSEAGLTVHRGLLSVLHE